MPSGAIVTVPEAAVDEDGDLEAGEHEVGTSRKARAMETESEPETVERGPDVELRLRVLLPNSRHDAASLLRGEAVHEAIMKPYPERDRTANPACTGVQPGAISVR